MKSLGLSLFLSLITFNNHALTEQVYRFQLKSQDELNKLIASEVDIWSLDRDKLEAIAVVDSTQMKELISLRPAIDQKRSQKLHSHSQLHFNKESVPKYQCYRIVETTYSDLEKLANENQNLVEIENIGESWQKLNKKNGYDIKVVKITNQATNNTVKPILFIDASIHAREMVTAELATRFAESLVKNYKSDPSIKKLLDTKQVHIVPYLNPDGRKVAEGIVYQRKNMNETTCRFIKSKRGVDLNRNFETIGWGEGAGRQGSRSGCSDTYRGPHTHSEPESQTLVNYLESIFVKNPQGKPSGMYISLHSFSELVLLPNTEPNDKNSDDYKKVVRLGKELALENGYKACVGDECLYPVHGSSDQWSYETFRIPSYTFELGKNFFEECDFFEKDILPKNLKALYKALELVD